MGFYFKYRPGPKMENDFVMKNVNRLGRGNTLLQYFSLLFKTVTLGRYT